MYYTHGSIMFYTHGSIMFYSYGSIMFYTYGALLFWQETPSLPCRHRGEPFQAAQTPDPPATHLQLRWSHSSQVDPGHINTQVETSLGTVWDPFDQIRQSSQSEPEPDTTWKPWELYSFKQVKFSMWAKIWRSRRVRNSTPRTPITNSTLRILVWEMPLGHHITLRKH